MTKIFCLVFVVCVAQVLAKPSPVDPHVVGGTKANEGDFPYAVTLNGRGRDFFCGGAIISKRHILTAAHCLEMPENMLQIGVGSVDIDKQKMYKVEKIMAHEDFEPALFENDIGVIKLKKDLKFSDTVKPIKYDYTKNLDGKKVTAIGWGTISANGPSSDILLYVNKTILENKKCRKMVDPPVHDSNICMSAEKNTGVCFGDSGSPLIYKEGNETYAVGIVSWGIPCAVGYPDVFSRVPSFIDWIREQMEK